MLSRLGLLSDDGTLTNAAAVCFVPSRDIMLRMGVFADSARVHILDNRQVTGTLFSMVDEAQDYILNNTRRAFVIDGTSLERREVPEIPVDAVREALFNAFCHRSYDDDAAIQIDVFWDHLDIWSPGLFPVGYEPDGYLSGTESASKPRNKLIATTLYRAGDIGIYGTGLRRIRSACDAQGVPFSVTESKNGVHVSFTRQEALVSSKPRSGIDKRRTRVLRYATERGCITTAEAAELLGEKDYTARRLLNSLVDIGLLEKTGGRSNRVYNVI